MEVKIITPAKYNDPTYSSGTACAVHFGRLGACSSEVSLALVLLHNLSSLPSLCLCRTGYWPRWTCLTPVQTMLFRLSIYQKYWDFYPRKMNFKCFIGAVCFISLS